jgi:hypothetical protein
VKFRLISQNYRRFNGSTACLHAAATPRSTVGAIALRLTAQWMRFSGGNDGWSHSGEGIG